MGGAGGSRFFQRPSMPPTTLPEPFRSRRRSLLHEMPPHAAGRRVMTRLLRRRREGGKFIFIFEWPCCRATREKDGQQQHGGQACIPLLPRGIPGWSGAASNESFRHCRTVSARASATTRARDMTTTGVSAARRRQQPLRSDPRTSAKRLFLPATETVKRADEITLHAGPGLQPSVVCGPRVLGIRRVDPVVSLF